MATAHDLNVIRPARLPPGIYWHIRKNQQAFVSRLNRKGDADSARAEKHDRNVFVTFLCSTEDRDSGRSRNRIYVEIFLNRYLRSNTLRIRIEAHYDRRDSHFKVAHQLPAKARPLFLKRLQPVCKVDEPCDRRRSRRAHRKPR